MTGLDECFRLLGGYVERLRDIAVGYEGRARVGDDEIAYLRRAMEIGIEEISTGRPHYARQTLEYALAHAADPAAAAEPAEAVS